MSLGIPFQVEVDEDSSDAPFLFGVTGHSETVVEFAIVPLTYQQFQDKPGISVSSVVDPGTTIPPPASESNTCTHTCAKLQLSHLLFVIQEIF